MPERGGISRDLAGLREDFGRLSETVSQLVRGQSRHARDAMASTGEALGETAEELGREGRSAIAGAGSRLQGVLKDLAAGVERNPFIALAAAAAVGLIIGLMRRARHD